MVAFFKTPGNSAQRATLGPKLASAILGNGSLTAFHAEADRVNGDSFIVRPGDGYRPEAFDFSSSNTPTFGSSR